MSGTKKRVAVVGAGWAGAVTAERLGAAGVDVEVFERAAN
ncbi:MAG: NAD(P)-binding protein, partial [Actinomycetota bacterium]|nr:NAD(P)-binding protein [Actinomycetota bacterium]